jgi:putative nucleotidyltransferase with HDIG domain
MRDAMTARHSAAVARYSREIARMLGLSEREQELIHTAALLHDIGKFIFPDSILFAERRLTDEEWQIVRLHPEQGAKLVRRIEGYGPVADIILSHHERVDGNGYPHGLANDAVPLGSRILAAADTYDVMTARDSYREPVSSFEAIQELQRVAGAQLDERFVKVFVEQVLEGKDLGFRHGEDADFDFELALEERIAAVEQGAGFLVGVDQDGGNGKHPHRDVSVGA